MSRIKPGALPGYQALFSIEPAMREKHGLKPRLTLTPDQMTKVRALTDIMEEEQQLLLPPVHQSHEVQPPRLPEPTADTFGQLGEP